MFGFGGGAGEWWGGRAFGDDMSFYQPLEALHHDGGECRWGEVVIERCNCGVFFGTGIVVAVLKHDGTTARC